MAAARAIFVKDLTIELRRRESVPAMVLFSVCAFVLFHFGLARNSLDGSLASGILWVTLLLATVLAVNRLFAADVEQGGIDAVRLSGVGGISMLIAKAGALLAYLVAFELVAVPSFWLLLLAGHAPAALLKLAAIMGVTDIGLAAVGSLVAALAARASIRDLLVPLMLLPLLAPALIGAASATTPLFTAAAAPAHLGRWLALLTIFDIVFVLISLGVYDFLMED